MKSLSLEQMEEVVGGAKAGAGPGRCWGFIGHVIIADCADQLMEYGGGNGNWFECYHICALACDYAIIAD